MAANQVAYELKLPIIHGGSTADKAAEPPKSWGMNSTVAQNETANMKVLLKYAPRPFKSVHAIVDNNDWGRSDIAFYQSQWQGRSPDEPKITGVDYVEASATDFMSILTKVKGSQADALLLVSTVATVDANVVKQAKEIGLTQQILICHGVLNQDFLDLAGSAGEGLVYSETYWPSLPIPEAQSFLTKYQAKTGGKLPDKPTVLGYIAMYHLLKAMDLAGTDKDVDAINKAIQAFEWDSPKGHIKMDPTNGRPAPTVYPVKIDGKKQVNLGPAL